MSPGDIIPFGAPLSLNTDEIGGPIIGIQTSYGFGSSAPDVGLPLPVIYWVSPRAGSIIGFNVDALVVAPLSLFTDGSITFTLYVNNVGQIQTVSFALPAPTVPIQTFQGNVTFSAPVSILQGAQIEIRSSSTIPFPAELGGIALFQIGGGILVQ